jgi:predicted dehydrogenase
VLVEKPLFDQARPLPASGFRLACVAYNLRFHPVVQRLKALLEGEDIVSAHAYAGQYLPDWRPGSDYRVSYSAQIDRGGGVLRDLSHELDYLAWVLGCWRRVAALGGHLSSLKISSDDVFSLLMSMERCPIVSVQLNYLERPARRTLVVNTNQHTFEADLIEGTLSIDRENFERFPVERDSTYRVMHEALLAGRTDVACSLDQGMQTLRLIDAARQSAQRLEWTSQ